MASSQKKNSHSAFQFLSNAVHDTGVYLRRAVTRRENQYRDLNSFRTMSQKRKLSENKASRKQKEDQEKVERERRLQIIRSKMEEERLRYMRLKKQSLLNEGYSRNNIDSATNSRGNIILYTQKELEKLLVSVPKTDPVTESLYKELKKITVPKTKPLTIEDLWKEYLKLRQELYSKDIKIIQDFVNKYDLGALPKHGKELLKKNLQIMINSLTFLYYNGVNSLTRERNIEKFRVSKNRYKSYFEEPIGEVDSPVNMTLKEYLESTLQNNIFDKLPLKIRYARGTKNTKKKKKRKGTKKKRNKKNKGKKKQKKK